MNKCFALFAFMSASSFYMTTSIGAVKSIESLDTWHDALRRYLVIAHFYQKTDTLKENKELYKKYKQTTRVFKKTERLLPEVLFVKVNSARRQLQRIAHRYSIAKTPTFLLFKRSASKTDPVLVARGMGIPTKKSLVRFLFKHVGKEIRQIRKVWQRVDYYHTYPMYHPFYLGHYSSSYFGHYYCPLCYGFGHHHLWCPIHPYNYQRYHYFHGYPGYGPGISFGIRF